MVHTHTHRGWATLFFFLCQIWCNFSFDFESGLRLELAAGVQPFESKAKVVISVGRDHYGKSTGAFVLWGKAKFIPLSVFLSPSTFLSLFSRSILYLSAPSPLALGTIKGFKWQCVVSRVWVQCPSEYFIHPALKLALRRFYVEAAVGEIQITDLWFFTL